MKLNTATPTQPKLHPRISVSTVVLFLIVLSVEAFFTNWWYSRPVFECHHSKLYPWEVTDDAATPLTLTPTKTPSEEAFSNLELFVSVFPGNRGTTLDDGDFIRGLTELRETFARTLLFFWPRDRYEIKVTIVLDDTTYTNEEDRTNLIQEVGSSFFPDDGDDYNSDSNSDSAQHQHNRLGANANENSNGISVRFNSRTNTTLYGPGWFIQQLIMLWADNFTDSEYIGFADSDTMFTSAISPYDLFDNHGRPRVVVQAAGGNKKQDKVYNQASLHAFKRPPRLYSMTYFPVIVKREHFAELREHLLGVHPGYSCFDAFFSDLVFRGENKTQPVDVCQFCLLADFLFDAHRAEYSWHFETDAATHPIEFATPEMYDPFPRVATHASYMYIRMDRRRKANTVAGRKVMVAMIMREGYCHSLVPSWNVTADGTNSSSSTTGTTTSSNTNYDRCKQYFATDELPVPHIRGQWRFEEYTTQWLTHPNITAAHAERKQHALADRVWDQHELEQMLFV